MAIGGDQHRLGVATLAAVAVLMAGCRFRQKPQTLGPPSNRPVEILKKPAIDLARGGAGFPLDTSVVPANTNELVEALTRAYASRLEADPSIDIRAEGQSVRQLKLLQIDLTGSTVRGDYLPKDTVKEKTKDNEAKTHLTSFMTADTLRYVADPLKYQTYSASLILEADQTELALVPTKDGKYTLALTDCRTGRATLRIDQADLRAGLVAGARLRKTIALAIEGVELNLQSQGEQSLAVDMVVRARVLMLPAVFRLNGRADVDSNFNVHFTHLSAAGADPSGAIVAGAVQHSLNNLNNKAAPLLRLPGDKIKVTDLRITLDEALTIDMAFAGTKR